MPTMTRRTVLAGAGAAALLTASPPLLARADGPTDQAKLRSNAVDIFAGTATSNASPAVAAKLAAIDKAAHARLTAMSKAGADELFAGKPLGTSDPNLNTSYSYLYEIALATRAPHPAGTPSDLYGDTDTQDAVINGLIWLYENYFGDQSKGYYGNWWNWEIGIPHSVSLILVLLYDRIAATHADLPATYIAALDGYLRSGKNGDVDLDSRFDTGANLADMTTNRILQGAVLGDDARITKAISDQMTVFATVDPYHPQHGVTDGYYADGSFIQHASVAYTGAYGVVLLTRVVQSVKILDGTGYATSGDLIATVQGWVTNGFAPLIFEGWMMEMVKGRQVSSRTTGYTNVASVVESVVDLASYSSGAEGAALKGYVAYLTDKSPVKPNPASFASPVTALRYADILADGSVVARDLNPAARTVAFNAMDRNVHRRPGYAFALARSSDRISKYEYMSGQNLMPWFQGDGAFYLYLSGQDQTQAYGVDYFTDVSPYRLSGTTTPVEERKTIPQLYGRDWYENPDSPLNFTSSSESQNTYVYFPVGTNAFSGSATLDTYAIAGMIKSDSIAYRDKQAGKLPDDFVVYKNAESLTSWIMLDDEIVVLTAGIHDTEDRAVTTALDSRIADPGDRVQLTGGLHNGHAWRDTGEPSDLRWLRYRNVDQDTAVGYVLLDRAQVQVSQEDVSNSLRIVRKSNPDTEVKKNVFGLSVTQAADDRRDGAVAYALLPNASLRDVRDYALSDTPVEVLSNSRRLQAVRHAGLGLTAFNAFTKGRHVLHNISVDGQASVIVREADDTVSVSVSDPTMARDTITVELRGYVGLHTKQVDDGVTVSDRRGRVTISVDTRHAYGRSFTARMAR